VLQYFRLVETLGITNRAARIILGSTFDWADIACYAVGCVFIVLFERIGKNS
jgi:membrane protein